MAEQYYQKFITFMSFTYVEHFILEHDITLYNNTCKILCTLPTILARLTIEPFVTFSLTISLATACVTRNVP